MPKKITIGPLTSLHQLGKLHEKHIKPPEVLIAVVDGWGWDSHFRPETRSRQCRSRFRLCSCSGSPPSPCVSAGAVRSPVTHRAPRVSRYHFRCEREFPAAQIQIRSTPKCPIMEENAVSIMTEHSPLTISNQPPHFQPSPTTTPVPIPLGAKSLSSALAPRPMSVRRFINHHQNGEGPMKFGRIDKPLYVRSIRQA